MTQQYKHFNEPSEALKCEQHTGLSFPAERGIQAG